MRLAIFRRHKPSGRTLHTVGLTAALTIALGLSACGGGGGDFGTFDVGILIAGQPYGSRYGPGSSPTVYVRAGQSIELDASESVDWTLYVAGKAISGSGTLVRYGGVDVTLTAVSSSRIIVDTYARYPLYDAIPMTLVATSTYDSAVVAAVNVLIKN